MDITIIGKSNNMISLLLDALSERFNTKISITIVKNIPIGDSPPFKMENSDIFSFSEIDIDTWKHVSNNLMLGAIRVPTKKTVYEVFNSVNKLTHDKFLSVVHPNSVISIQSKIGSGVYIGPGSIVAPYVTIGDLVSINRKVSVGHHTTIGDFTTLNPGVNIAGGSKIGSCTTIGMGANVFDGVDIGDNVIVGAGSLVNKSLPNNVIAYGVPARIAKQNVEL